MKFMGSSPRLCSTPQSEGSHRCSAPTHETALARTVLYIIEGFSAGGAERKLLELVQHLDGNRFRPVICTLGLGDDLRAEFEATGVKIHFLQKRARFFDWRMIRSLAHIARQEKADVIHTTLFYADVAGAIAARLAGVRALVAWEVASSPETLRLDRRLSYWLTNPLRRRIISVSEETRRYLIRKRWILPRKITVIPYGVDLTRFRSMPMEALRKSLGVGPHEVAIGVVARLAEQKGHAYLIEAAQDIVARYPQARFLLVGSGPLEETLRLQVETLGLQDRIHFLGFRRDVIELLNTFDIFVLPSLFEGLPNALLEAMACALPVVATSVDGNLQAVADGETGYLVPPRNSKSLAEKIAELIASPERRKQMGQRGRKRVEQQFSLQEQVHQIQQLYDQLLSPERA